MTNQSDRIRWIKEFNAHPKKEEYLENRNKILSKKPISVYLIPLGYIYFFAMFVFWGWIFFSSKGNKIIGDLWCLLFNTKPIIGDVLFIIAAGIINIILGFLFVVWSIEAKEKIIEEYNKSALDSLNKQYRDKYDLFYYTDKCLWNGCGDYDQINECYRCSATQEYLTRDKYNSFCKQPRNCYQCDKFMALYLGKDGHEY